MADPNREIGFGFVSCSCRACVRAGEAKLRERVRDDAFSSLVAILARCAAGGGPVAWIWRRQFLKTVFRVLRQMLLFGRQSPGS